MSGSHPERVVDPVCGMVVDVARAEAGGLTVDYRSRTYAFCRPGCRRAFEEEPDLYAAKAEATQSNAPGADEPEAVGAGPVAAQAGSTDLPVIDEGIRRWYESCPCCLSEAYPELKAALDAERAAKAEAAVGPGICEVAEAAEAVAETAEPAIA